MKAIIDFFQSLFDVIFVLIDFVISFIGDLVYVVQLTGNFLANIPLYFAWLPEAFLSVIITIFSIVVIYKIIGREG